MDIKLFGVGKAFGGSARIGVVYQITRFVFALVCGYLVSLLLDAALAADVYGAAVYGAGALAALLGGLVPIYVLSLRRNERRALDAQGYREYLYGRLVERRLDVGDGGEMSVKLNKDADTVARYRQDVLPEVVGSCVVLAASAGLLLFADWRVGAVFFGINLTQLLPTVLYERWARKTYNRIRYDEAAYCDWLIEGYRGIRAIKAYEREGWFTERFRKLNLNVYLSGKRAEQVGTVEYIASEAVNALLNYGSYVILGLFILYGGLPVERTPILIVLGSYLFSSMKTVYDTRIAGFAYKEAARRLAEVGDEGRVGGGSGALLSVVGVCKAFEGKAALNGASFSVARGEKVLLSGENGAGKTTLLNIVLGFLAPDDGVVTFGGGIDARRRYESIAFAMQEEARLGESGSEIVAALLGAGEVDGELLSGHLRGFRLTDELLGKRLDDWSMGERKKLFLAAAFAKPAELLVLDEPTNHIDAESVGYLVGLIAEYPAAVLAVSHDGRLDNLWDREIAFDLGGVE